MNGNPIPLDSGWIAANPLPVHGPGTTKNSRGRVLAIGGSARVPGALRLTGEAALRVGAGKVQLASVASAATMLGLMVPEAAVIALPETDDGEIGSGAVLRDGLDGCGGLVIGPGIGSAEAAAGLLTMILAAPHKDLTLVVDAMAIGCVRDRKEALLTVRDRLILTPHYGEMAILSGRDEEEVAEDPGGAAIDMAAELGAVVVLKGTETVIADPQGALLHYGGGGTGLATGGSGDVLAGAIAGLASRGASPLVAAAWGVWLHGQAGRRAATVSGPIGFLAREVPPEFPRLLPQ